MSKNFSHLLMDIFSYFDFCECRRNAFRSLSNKLTWQSDACTYVIHTIEWSGQFYSWRDLVVLIARYLKKNRLLSFEIRDSKSNHNLIKNYVCLFVSWVGSNLCLTNWICICRVPQEWSVLTFSKAKNTLQKIRQSLTYYAGSVGQLDKWIVDQASDVPSINFFRLFIDSKLFTLIFVFFLKK